ncbi:MAG: hypothetical protein Kow0092_08200 [Deferrisomatales bacterium]
MGLGNRTVAVFALVAGVFLYGLYSAYDAVRRKTIDDFNVYQLSLAEQAATGIESLLRNYEADLAFLAGLEPVAALDKAGRDLLDRYWEANRDNLAGVTRVDARGVIVYTVPDSERALGADIHDQEHVARALATRQPTVSDVFQTVQGFRAVAYHVPVWRDGRFDGTLAILISFESLARRYLEGIRVARNGAARMLSEKGIDLYCPVPGHVGRPAEESARRFPSLGAFIQAMRAGEQGMGAYWAPGPGAEAARPVRYQAAYHPVRVGDTFWSIAVSTPEEEVVATMKDFRNRWVALAGLLLALGVFSAHYAVRASAAFREGRRLRRLAEKLQASEAYFRDLVHLAPLPTVVADRAGRAELVSERFAALLGYGGDELEPMEGWWRRAVTDPDRGAQVCRVWEAGGSASAPVGQVSEVPIRCADGRVRRFDVICSAIGERRVALFSDVTERVEAEQVRRELEESLERSRKMEALGLLAGGVAHDLNNILSGVVTYPELLLRDLPADSPLRRPLEAVLKSGERAAAVVADLLTMARGVATPRHALDLNEPVGAYRESAELTQLQRSFPEVRVRFDLAGDLPPIEGSSVHLQKVCMNLVSNAVEAAAAGGAVTVSTAAVTVEAPLEGYETVPAGRYAVLTVVDDGPGISPEDAQRIFEPFYTRKELGRSGTGLGLAVVWSTVHEHGGHIQLESGSHGTVFRVFFPAADPARIPSPAAPAREVREGGGERILVVDDDPGQREVARDLLDHLGYRVRCAAGGREALDLLAQEPAELVLLDMIMPGMGGRETYEAILERHPGQRALVVSGFSQTEDVDRTLALGAASFLRKPYRLRELGAAIRDALGQAPGEDGGPPPGEGA